MANISFGTDGFRGILDKDFDFENVEIIVSACAKYILEKYGKDKKIVIGYDGRNEADCYAIKTGDILRSFGLNFNISKNIIPTPIIAFDAKYYNACAFMITASHNPPEYLGIKFIPDFGGPATTDITNEITNNFNNSPAPKDIQKGTVVEFPLVEPYFEHLEKIIDFEKIKNLKTNIIFDGLYSAAIGYFDKLLEKHQIPFEKMNCVHDINFGGGMPDPKPKYLKDLIEKIKNTKNTIGLANDGDGDRFGVINENGEYVTPNEIIGILLNHLIKNKNAKGALAITVAGSSMLKILAKKLGVKVIETPVGFKWLGEAMRKNEVIIAGEDSGGLSIGSHIPEKDGILANLLILEAMAYENKSLVELQNEFHKAVGVTFKQDRLDYKFTDKQEMTNVINYFSQINDFYLPIKNISKLDGLKITFANDSWILIRPSGTEPLLRIYFEAEERDLDIIKNSIETRVQPFLN